MTTQTVKPLPHGIRTSPWLITSVAVILFVILTILAVRNINREKAFMKDYLYEMGSALISSFEAGARTGMAGMMGRYWGDNQLQFLLEETSRLPGVVYLIVTDRTGKILAHNNKDKIGNPYFDQSVPRSLDSKNKIDWRILKTDASKSVFEVYKYFRPLNDKTTRNGFKQNNSNSMWQSQKSCCSMMMNSNDKDRIIYIGLDMTSFEAAQRQDIQFTIVFSLTLLLLGVVGFLSVNYAHHYLRTHKKLEDTSWFASELVLSLPIGLIATNSENKIAFFNTAAQQITGIQSDDVKDKSPGEVFDDNMHTLKEYLEEGRNIFEEEIDCLDKDNKVVALSVSTAQILNQAGAFLGNIVTLRSMDEVRHLQREIRQREKLAAIGKLAAGVAHEIRNPLSSIKGMAGFLKSKMNQESEDWNSASIIISEVERLNRVVGQLLDFAKPLELRIFPENLNSVLDRAIEMVRLDIQDTNIVIQFNKNDSSPLVLIDKDRFLQSLLNLFLNAIQAMEADGCLSISYQKGMNNNIDIIIKDNGVGIKTDDLKRIFEPYFTLKSSGTGLGLSIVNKIIEDHQGKVKVQSIFGKGTSFIITIPMAHTTNIDQ